MTVTLKFEPLKPCVLMIQGVQWTVFQMPTRFFFSFQRNYVNKLNILPSSHKLTLRLVNFDNRMLHGQIKKVTAELKNEGNCRISSVYLKFLNPVYFGQTDLLVDQPLEPSQAVTRQFFIHCYHDFNFEARILVKSYADQNYRYSRFVVPVKAKPAVKINQTA